MKWRKKIGLLIVLSGFGGLLHAQNDSVFNRNIVSTFNLFQTNPGHTTQLTSQDFEKKLTLFIFLSPECPLCQNSLPVLNLLQEEYKNNISFYGIIPGKAYDAAMINQFAAEYNVLFPLFVDSSKALSEYFRATVTPQVILLSNDLKLVYKGAIDDRLMELGKRRVAITNEYLRQAIVLALDNKAVPLKRTKAVGCKINDY